MEKIRTVFLNYNIEFIPYTEPVLIWIIIIASGMFAALIIAFKRQYKKSLYTCAAMLLIAVYLYNPSIAKEDKKEIQKSVLLLIDNSLSAEVQKRNEQVQNAQNILLSRLSEMGFKVNLKHLSDFMAKNDSSLGAFINKAENAVIPNFHAGSVLITDAITKDQVIRSSDKPLNVLLVGSDNDNDLSVEVTKTPRYAKIGDQVEIQYKVSQFGKNKSKKIDVSIISNNPDSKPIEAEAELGKEEAINLPITMSGKNEFLINVKSEDAEISSLNNQALISINGIRERMSVLLITGKIYSGQRMWRDFLKNDPNIDLVHFNILKDVEDSDPTPAREMSLIPFPVNELFYEKLPDFDLVIFDNYQGVSQISYDYLDNIARYVKDGGSLLVIPENSDEANESIIASELRTVLPFDLRNNVSYGDFSVAISESGRKHPLVRSLKEPLGKVDKIANFQLKTNAIPLLEGVNAERGSAMPFMAVARVNKGRVAMVTSSDMWKWSRGYGILESKGVDKILTRNIIHWLLREANMDEVYIDAKLEGRKLIFQDFGFAAQNSKVQAITPDSVLDIDPTQKEIEFQNVYSHVIIETSSEVYGNKRIFLENLDNQKGEYNRFYSDEEKFLNAVKVSDGRQVWLHNQNLNSIELSLDREKVYEKSASSYKSIFPAYAYMLAILIMLVIAWWGNFNIKIRNKISKQ